MGKAATTTRTLEERLAAIEARLTDCGGTGKTLEEWLEWIEPAREDGAYERIDVLEDRLEARIEALEAFREGSVDGVIRRCDGACGFRDPAAAGDHDRLLRIEDDPGELMDLTCRAFNWDHDDDQPRPGQVDLRQLKEFVAAHAWRDVDRVRLLALDIVWTITTGARKPARRHAK